MEKRNKAIRKIAYKYIDQILNGTLMNDIMRNAHTDIYHTGNKYKNTTEKINRLLNTHAKTTKRAESTFENGEETIQNILLDNIETIAKWVYEDKKTEKRLTITSGIESDDEPIGTGVRYKDDKLQECIAYETTIVLEQADNQYGFSCVTAYPNILHKTAQPTYRDIRPELHETNAYKNASEEQKQIWDQMVLNGLKKSDTKKKITHLNKRNMPHNADELLAAETKDDDYYFGE